MNGSIQHRPDRPSPWKARYSGGDGRQHSKSFERKIDAERWLRSQLATLDRGEWVDPAGGQVTFGEWAESWRRGLHDVKPKTRAGYESLLRSRILPSFANWQLRQISPAVVREWVSAMVDDGLSPARIRQARQVLSAVLAQAVADGLVVRNPAAGVKPPQVRARRQLFLSAPEVARLADVAEGLQVGAGVLVRVLAYSGLRWGEAVALKRSAVDVKKRRLRVKEAATEVGGRLSWGTPKTHETRTVIVPAFIMGRLGPHLGGLTPDDLVFRAPMGGPLRTSNFRRGVWARAVTEAGMPAGLLVHDLRDTAASLMISSGASIKAVQRQLGHASASMTLDVYGGLFEDDLDELADRLEARFARADRAHTGPKDAKIVHLAR